MADDRIIFAFGVFLQEILRRGEGHLIDVALSLHRAEYQMPLSADGDRFCFSRSNADWILPSSPRALHPSSGHRPAIRRFA